MPDFNKVYDMTYEAIKRMKARKDTDYLELANHKITSLVNEDPVRASGDRRRWAGTVEEVWLKGNALIYHLQSINKDDDSLYDDYELNIKYIFWLTVFFDGVAAKCERKVDVELDAELYIFNCCCLSTTFREYASIAKGPYIEISYMNESYKTGCTVLIKFPDWVTSFVDPGDLPLVKYQYGIPIDYMEETITLNTITVNELIQK